MTTLPVRWIDTMNNGAHMYPAGRTMAEARTAGNLFALGNYCPPGSGSPEEVLRGYGRLFGSVAFAKVTLADVARIL